jgi:hypothetical protein
MLRDYVFFTEDQNVVEAVGNTELKKTQGEK